MRIIGRLVGLAMGLVTLTALGGALAALSMRERITRREDPDADDVAIAAIFGPLAFRSRARSFRGGTLDVWYGGGIVDLREARLDPSGARLKVRALFGGAQLVVPDSWRVETKVVGLGGVGDSRLATDRPADAPTLVVEGFVLFGGFGISSTVPEGSDAWMARAAGAPEEAPAATPAGVA